MIEKVSQETIQETKSKLDKLFAELKKEITGQEQVIQKIVICLLSGGHILLEGMPGLAKTLLAKSIAKCLDLPFKRIQFTPDLLPADLIGTVVFNPKTTSFETRKGPIFTGILLADEINRAPAKVQSALLQCMEEKMVTIGENTYQIDLPFWVIATENPIEQEGTYPLPEAQMDRFLMKIDVSYPSFDEEVSILNQHGSITPDKEPIHAVLSKNEILEISNIVDFIYIDQKLKNYIVKLVQNSRPATSQVIGLSSLVKHGASPRASLSLLKASRAIALLEGRNYVLPQDIVFSASNILKHRIILTFDAISEDVSIDVLIKSIVESTPLP